MCSTFNIRFPTRSRCWTNRSMHIMGRSSCYSVSFQYAQVIIALILLLFRFPANETSYPREVWCQKSGLMWLVKNKYILSTVTVGSRPYYAYDVSFNS